MPMNDKQEQSNKGNAIDIYRACLRFCVCEPFSLPTAIAHFSSTNNPFNHFNLIQALKNIENKFDDDTIIFPLLVIFVGNNLVLKITPSLKFEKKKLLFKRLVSFIVQHSKPFVNSLYSYAQ